MWVLVCLYAPYTIPIIHTYLPGLLSNYKISGIRTDESVFPLSCFFFFFITPTTSPSGSAELRDDPSHQTQSGLICGYTLSLLMIQSFKPSPHCFCLSLYHPHRALTNSLLQISKETLKQKCVHAGELCTSHRFAQFFP